MADYDLTVSTVATGGGENLFGTNELPVDMHKKLWSVYPGTTPFLSKFSQLSEDTARNYRIDWMEEAPIPTKVVLGNAASTGTSLTVPNGYGSLVIDSVLYNPRAGDYASVDALPTSSTVTVTRSALGSTAVAWVVGDVLWVLPPRSTESEVDTYRTSSTVLQNGYNLLELIRMGTAITRMADKMDTHFGGQGVKRTQMQNQKLNEVKQKMEQLFWVGGRSTTGTAPATQRSMGGLVGYLKSGTLYKDFGGFMTESGFRSFLGDHKDQNPDANKVDCYCAGNVIDIINAWGLNKVQTSSESTVYGFDIYSYKSRGLSVNLIPVPLFNDPVTKGWLFLLDAERIALKYMDKLALLRDCRGIGESEYIYDLYRTVVSMMVANESRHAMAINALV